MLTVILCDPAAGGECKAFFGLHIHIQSFSAQGWAFSK